jgi:hypothetical protein
MKQCSACGRASTPLATRCDCGADLWLAPEVGTATTAVREKDAPSLRQRQGRGRPRNPDRPGATATKPYGRTAAKHWTVEATQTAAFGLGFGILFMGVAAWAGTWGDPWGVIVLVAAAPGLAFERSLPRGSIGLMLVICAGTWAMVGAALWFAFSRFRAGRG